MAIVTTNAAYPPPHHVLRDLALQVQSTSTVNRAWLPLTEYVCNPRGRVLTGVAATMIDAIFAKGVFRPLKPVALAENQRVKITLEDAESLSGQDIPRHSPAVYPDDDPVTSDSDFDYLPVPKKNLGMVQARVVFLGSLLH